jgi:hypothetical protein
VVADYEQTLTTLQPGQQATASWAYPVQAAGDYRVQFGAWKQKPYVASNLLHKRPDPSQVLIRGIAPTPTEPTASIVSYSPSSLTTTEVGNTVTLSVTIRNTGDVAWQFIAGASVWSQSTGAVVADYEQTLTTLQPGQQATASWAHSVQAAGDYRVQFGAWKQKPYVASNLLHKRPDPSQVLIRGTVPTPTISGVSPAQPKVQSTRQWLTVLGSGFAAGARVTLRIGGSTYIIPADRTEFLDAGRIRVYVGLTDSGTWSAQVKNPDGAMSNIFYFQVVP